MPLIFRHITLLLTRGERETRKRVKKVVIFYYIRLDYIKGAEFEFKLKLKLPSLGMYRA